jgi:enoyl-CoA hydratase/carnithine racemase
MSLSIGPVLNNSTGRGYNGIFVQRAIMTEYVHTRVANGIGFITLDRPKALNSLSLEMVRALTAALLAWRDDPAVAAVFVQGRSPRAFCAGGDIRFFHRAGSSTPQGGSALIEDFFTEEYSLDYLVQTYPKPYVALLDGVVMGGGMGIGQAGQNGLRIVTERTRMAMPETNIGFFPDVGASYFLSRAPGAIGVYLGLTSATIGAADALYAGLADVFVPSSELEALQALADATPGAQLAPAIRGFASAFASQAGPSELQAERAAVDGHFGQDSVAAVMDSLARDDSPFAQRALAMMRLRSPLMMCVVQEELKRGTRLGLADCLRMERTLVRRAFEVGEVLEGVRALAIDKDNAPRWKPSMLEDVTPAMVARFFEPAWPAYAHPLRSLGSG